MRTDRQDHGKTSNILEKYLNQFLVLLVSVIVLWPILPSAFSADDTFDSFVPFQLRYSNQPIWSFIGEVIQNWKVEQGRFFPGAVILGTFAHFFFPERGPYKVLQLVMAVCALICFFVFVQTFCKSKRLGSLTVLLVICCTQIHVQYDALLHFSVQQPSVMILFSLTFLSFIVGIRHDSWRFLTLSATLFGATLLTYETTVLLWPIFPILLYAENPKKWKSKLLGTMIVPTIVVLNLLRLRSQVTTTAAGYTSNFDIGPLSRTFLRQSIASVPMSYSELQTPPFLLDFPHHLFVGAWYWWLAIILTVILLVRLFKKIEIPSARVRLSMVMIGLVLWLTPALVVAQTVRWQSEIVLGNGYITAYQGYFGFSLFFVGVLLQVLQLVNDRTTALRISSLLVVGVLVLVSISSVVVNNRAAAAQYNPGYLWARETFERSINVGVFDGVEKGTRLITFQEQYWFNAPFIYWWGGPKFSSVVTPSDRALHSDCISDVATCEKFKKFGATFSTYGSFLGEPRVVVVGNIVKMTSVWGDLKIIIRAPSIYIDYPTLSPSVKDSNTRCTAWITERLTNVRVNVTTTDISIVEAKVGSCFLNLSEEVDIDILQFAPA